MTTHKASHVTTAAQLHVFEQDGGWHWGITIPRAAGSGFKLVSYSDKSFAGEAAARKDGDQALRHLSASGNFEAIH